MPHVIAGRYELDHELGRGGMGAVWLAHDRVLDRAVAMKMIGQFPGSDRADLARVRREARVSAMLLDPHVVGVFDLVEGDGRHWLVMEYVEHETLAERIRRKRRLSPDTAAPLLAQVARALATAHAAGIVHRDVKPSNILITREDHVKLGDFGIARTGTDPSLTQTGLVTGSPGYLAPEVAAGSKATPASDVWSLGATLFHALEGRPAYDTRENLMAALYQLVNEEPPRTNRAGWLTPVLLATMHREPKRRWTAGQVAAFLDTGRPDASREPIATQVLPPPPPPLPERTRAFRSVAPGSGRTVRRVPALVALVLVPVMAIGGWLLMRDGTDPRSPDANGDRSSYSPTQEPDATEAGMQSFVGRYLNTAASDPATAWNTMLTPAFRDESGSYQQYLLWWGRVEQATLKEVTAVPADLTVEYVVEYRYAKGVKGRPKRDEVRLELVFEGGEYRIDHEPGGHVIR